jgi:hypothetical protein
MGEKDNTYRLLMVKAEGSRLLGRPTPRWAVNIKMNLQEIGSGGGGILTGLVWFRIGTIEELL